MNDSRLCVERSGGGLAGRKKERERERERKQEEQRRRSDGS
jgi:hypothetical protein